LKSTWRLAVLTLALGLSLAVSACVSGGKVEESVPASDDKTIKIGFIGPLTGNLQTFGESTKNAFLLALEQAGDKAGDYRIEYIVADDKNDADEAVKVATRLITQEKVKAVVGSITSKTSIPISDIANQNHVVMITSAATHEKITVADGTRKEYVFRACLLDPVQGTAGAKFALETLKAKKAAVLYDHNNEYSTGLAKNFKNSFAKSGEVVAFETTSAEDKGFPGLLTAIAEAKPDVLYLPFDYPKAGLVGQQARNKGIATIFLGGDLWDSLDLNFTALDGGYFTNHYSPEEPRPEVKDWVQQYKAKYNAVPDIPATLSYDSARLLLNAIKTANSDEPAKIREALQATRDFPAVSGKITFNESGNPVKHVVIMQVKDGKIVYTDSVTP